MKFLVLGASGMAGHMVTARLREQGHKVVTIVRQSRDLTDEIVADARDLAAISSGMRSVAPDIVVNCIGILNRDAADNPGDAVLLNSYLPHFLAQELEAMGHGRLIHISTDCVFSGKRGNYTEADPPDAEDIYGRSKALGEVVASPSLTLRTSIVGPDRDPGGIGLLNWFLQQSSPVAGFTDAIWGGVTTLVLARAVERAAHTNAEGLYHLTNSEKITKFDLLSLFNEAFLDGRIEIQPTAGSPVDKSIVSSRDDLGLDVPSYREQVQELADWARQHSEAYPHYPFQRWNEEAVK